MLAGFAVDEVWTDYDGQYLMITAHPVPVPATYALQGPCAREIAAALGFGAEAAHRIGGWRDTIDRLKASGRTAAIWGSGSKGVAFLSAIGAHVDDGGIPCAVDINPYRKGYYMPGTGQEIVEPAALKEHAPAVVIAMNSVYTAEIEAELQRQGVRAALVPIEALEPQPLAMAV